MAGWWLVYVGIPTPLKNMKVIVSWDDDIPNIWKVIKFHGSMVSFITKPSIYWRWNIPNSWLMTFLDIYQPTGHLPTNFRATFVASPGSQRRQRPCAGWTSTAPWQSWGARDTPHSAAPEPCLTVKRLGDLLTGKICKDFSNTGFEDIT